MSTDFESQWLRLHQAAGTKTEAELARLMGVTPASVTGVKRRQMIPLSWFQTVAVMFGASLDWLILGTKKVEPIVIDHVAADTNTPDDIYPPVVDKKLKAGQLVPCHCPPEIGFKLEYLRGTSVHPSSLSLCHIGGDAMAPAICAGDAVVFDTAKTQLYVGHMYALAFHDSSSIIIRTYDEEPGAALFRAENTAYPPFRVQFATLKEQVKVLGMAVFSGRMYK